MNTLTKLRQRLCNHKGTWTHPDAFPTHGYKDLPIDGATCSKRGKVAHWQIYREGSNAS